MRVRRPPGRIVTLAAAVLVGGALAGGPGGLWAGTVASADPPAGPVPSVVVDSVPGFSVASSGPLSTHRFASYDPDPAAVAAALGRLSVGGGFNAYLRTWSGGTSGTALGDVVVTFAEPAQAATYVSAARASLPAGPALPPDPVPGVTGVFGVTYPSPYSPAATERVLLFTVGRSAVIIGASEPGASTTLVAGPMVTLAVDQHRLLAASPYGRPRGRWWNNRVVGWGAVVLGVLALILAVGLVWSSRRRRSIDTMMPAETAPVIAAPVLAVPVDAVPADSVLADSVPADSVPVDSVPADSVPAGAVPVEGADASPIASPNDAALADAMAIGPEPTAAEPVDVGSAPVGRPADVAPVAAGSLGALATNGRAVPPPSAPVEPPPGDGSVGAAVLGAGSAEGATAIRRSSGTPAKGSEPEPGMPRSFGPPASPTLPLPPAGTAPGWLPDPSGAEGHIRYWDGIVWTVHTARPL